MSNLIFLYGPPASGKLTVANILAKKTGYRVFHNHLIADLASSLFPFGTKDYSDLALALRRVCLQALLSSKIPGAIFTWTYGAETYQGKEEDRFIRWVLEEAKRHSVRVSFVRLISSQKELLRRVKNRSRRKFKKLTQPKILKKILKEYALQKPIHFVESLTINTDKTSPRRAAELVKKTYLSGRIIKR